MKSKAIVSVLASAMAIMPLLSQSACGSDSDVPQFNQDVRPILSRNCFACHGQDEHSREADLRLGVPGNTAITPKDLEQSEFWARVTSSDPDVVMPPPDSEKSLSPQDKQVLRRWIESGADYEQHWAFVTPKKPMIPKLADERLIANPIDAFVQRRLQEQDLSPSEVATKEQLIRRVTLDLTGLPPTLAEVDRFLADDSEEAFEKLVDDLQSRVTYGEHMARYWLDLARYADTHGLHLDNERSMWPYRDWVVQAMNGNLPFDDFTRWQLAGDLLPDPSRNQLIASGFNRCNVTTGEGGSIQEEWIYRYAVERTSTTAQVWMGLTAGCAVCHDHKFDPISTKEYYSMYAFFHSAADPAMDGNRRDTPPILKLPTDEDQQLIEKLKNDIDAVEQEIESIVAAVTYSEPTGETSSQPEHSWNAWRAQDEEARNKALSASLRKQMKGRSPDEWSQEETDKVFRYWLRHVHSETVASLKPTVDRKSELAKEKTRIENAIPLTFVMADLDKPRKSFVMLRGAYDKPGEQVTRNVPSFLPSLPEKANEQDYNRLDLANWLLSPEHPLTARVTVNRLWQQFFGVGLVETSEDFGTQGQPPSHPQLLDWLALQFIEDGWDMKRMVKRIVTSHTYRQSSRITPDMLARDPNNRLLARAPRLRLDAEVIRDQALFVSGRLVTTVGGVGVKPYQPENIWEPVAFGGSNTRFYKQGTGDDLYRRSLYTFLKRTAPAPFMSTFDAPNREQSCSRRGRSNTPMQALQLMNDVQHFEAARNLASRILREGGESDSDRITWAWRTVIARRPDAEESDIATQSLAHFRTRFSADAAAAEKLISNGESKPDDSLEKAELAAWTMLSNLILNLDESVNKN